MILKRRPWVVHDDLFSIELYNPAWRAVDFYFNNMVIWIRVYQLSLRAMNGAMGLQLGGCIGKAIGVDHRVEGGNLGEFLRIRAAAATVGETSTHRDGSEAPLNGAVHEEEGTDNAPPAAARIETTPQGDNLAQVASMTDAPAAPARNSKRTIQGINEVCHPIQAKRPKLPLTRMTPPIDSGTRKTGMSSINSPKEVAEESGRITVNLLSYSPIHIDVTVASASGSFHFSGLHGHCVDKHKHLTCEKEGGRRKLLGLLDTFQDCLDRNNLLDCKPISGWFTWLHINSVSGAIIRERLDRFMATTDWISLFPDYRISSIYIAKSDHCFLLMDASQVNVSARGGSTDYFRFDTCWSKEDACIARVRSTWLRSPCSTVSKLQAIGDSFRTPLLMKPRRLFLMPNVSTSLSLTRKKLIGPNGPGSLGLLRAIATLRISMPMPPVDERKIAYGDINPTKAPGIDGLPGSFFRHHWELIGSDIIQLCHDLLSRRIDMSCVNATVITLIPKIEDPMRMQQLRPISLCTVVYKIVSKIILNRMKPLLPGFISENQSTFLKGRLISDNILIAHELLHYLCSSKNGPNKVAALKLDMEKAFDRVEWTFLRSVLLRMEFHSDCVDLLMDCVSSVTFRIWINGRLTPTIVPQRGLRQGDPLSPFPFVICMQGLSATLLDEKAVGRLLGIRASQKGPRVNHLLEASRLKEVLRLFADSSGQRINFGKSTVFYNPNTPLPHRRRLSSILGITEVFDPGIYLEVPLRVGKNKTNTFDFINEKVDDRVLGWTKRLLFFGGREIFLKFVAQALPLYIMSCYLLPRTMTDRITSSMRRYWWSGKLSKRG
ncbi:hypothetical protein GQ457_18G011690 [Hibiscus cannabinus]